jgi:hypothetical protein
MSHKMKLPSDTELERVACSMALQRLQGAWPLPMWSTASLLTVRYYIFEQLNCQVV